MIEGILLGEIHPFIVFSALFLLRINMRFNTATATSKTTNYAGGEAYRINPKSELISILLTSFIKAGAYRSDDETMIRLKELIAKTDPLFVAKAAIYARREFGMRSVTHIAAGEIAKNVKGQVWTKRFFARVFKRPDDMLETLAYYTSSYGKHPIPNSLKKGIAMALGGYGEYSLAKYRGEGKAIKMVDLVNLTHPKETPTIKKLMKGELKNTETWESKLSGAGKLAASEDEKEELKAEAWRELLTEGKIGYFALLRNLRNIEQQAPDLIPRAVELLKDRGAIKKSLILPFQFLKASENITNRVLLVAVSEALEIALDNCPKFSGKTLVAIDSSGSMEAFWPIASLFGSVLYKSNDSDIVTFSVRGEFARPTPSDSLVGITRQIPFLSGGTNFSAIFATIGSKKYDRVIILSDMQGWVTGGISYLWENYRKNINNDAVLYSIDLAGLGTLQTPENKTFLVAGFSEKIFDTMKMLEEDRNALINRIEAEAI